MAGPRLTYALIDKDVVKAIALLVSDQQIEGIPCFAVGYAVAEGFRRQGFATDILEKGIAEMRESLGRHMKAFYIEAVVGTSNVASHKVAAKVISADPKPGTDYVSGQPALAYLRLSEC